MSEQKKKAAPETEKVETPKIPHVAYPLKPRSNTTNLSQQYFNHLAGDESARFLFNNSGLWHRLSHKYCYSQIHCSEILMPVNECLDAKDHYY